MKTASVLGWGDGGGGVMVEVEWWGGGVMVEVEWWGGDGGGGCWRRWSGGGGGVMVEVEWWSWRRWGLFAKCNVCMPMCVCVILMAKWDTALCMCVCYVCVLCVCAMCVCYVCVCYVCVCACVYELRTYVRPTLITILLSLRALKE